LTSASHKLSEMMYRQAGQQGAQAETGGQASGPAGGAPPSGGPDDEVIDAEVVDENKKD
jgi:hypothetical protein